jgi:hypothetical protein
MRALTPKADHEALKQFFPAKNDDYACGYEEELHELNDFGITTEDQLLDLLRKRVDEVMEIDRSPMSERDIQMHSDADGGEFVANRLREGFWFSYPALLRIALELEYGDSYKQYANRRDAVPEPAAAPDGGPTTMPVGISRITERPQSVR